MAEGGGDSCPKVTDYSNWMSELSEKATEMPLNRLAIPGSHNSFAYWLDKDGPLGPDCDTALIDLAKIFGSLAKDILNRWSLTQSLDITAQLDAGIRYFDVRVSSRAGSEELYVLHGLYGIKLDTLLQDVRAFLAAHPKEVVLLDCNHFYGMDDFQHKQCLSMILEVLGYKMCPLLNMASVTLETLWESDLQAIVFYQAPCVADYPQFWPGKSVPSPWPNVCDVDKMLAFLSDRYARGRPPGSFYVTQGILTPDTGFILKHLTSSLRKSMCDKCSRPFVNWLVTKKAGSSGINICIMDFVEDCDYISTVLRLNKLL